MKHHSYAFALPSKWLVLMLFFCLHGPVHARTPGDPHKYRATPDHPACRFFDGYAYNADGTVIVPRTGLVWKRCAEGATWNGQACSSNGTEMNWMEAMRAAKASRFLGHSDWRLPTRAELEGVAGHYEQCKSNDWKKGQYAASTAIAHPADKDKSPGWFWSSSPVAGDDNFAWGVSFRSGHVTGSYRHFTRNVRLIRTDPALTSVVTQEFEVEYTKLDHYQKRADEQTSRLKVQMDAEEPLFRTQQARNAEVRSLLTRNQRTCLSSLRENLRCP